jgi:tetratricopeptide (TPR) repeat protein
VIGLIAALAGIAAWRSHRELLTWLGRDELAARRGVRAGLLIAVSALVGLAWLRAAHAPLHFSGGGVDVVLAIDVSSSMDARDTAPSRLRRAKRLAERLVAEPLGPRFGLVVFAGDAFPAVPLTHDRDALGTYLRTLDSELMSKPGSDLVRALGVASDVFDPRADRSRALILLSDGEHAGGDLDAALPRMRRLGVRVISVGFGTSRGARVPTSGMGPLEDARGDIVVSRRQDALLERIARATEGIYFREREDDPQPAALLSAARARARAPAAPTSAALDGLLVLAAALLVGEVFSSTQRGRWALSRRRSAVGAAMSTLLLATCGPGGWIEEGDQLLQGDQARRALSLYRKAERASGSTPLTSIRIGNAYYRLDEYPRATAAYVEALRTLGPEDDAARFQEARDAFWAAMREKPSSLEAKFNYEWALERVEPPVIPPLPSARKGEPTSATESPRASDSSEEGQPARASAEARPAGLSPSEAARWLESLEEPLAEPLRREIERSLQGGRSRTPEGQTW